MDTKFSCKDYPFPHPPTPPHPSRSVVQHANDNYYNDDEFNDDKNYSGDDDVDENNLGSVCCF